MKSSHRGMSVAVRLGIGLAAGVAIAAVDNFTSRGEVSPIVIVALLLGATGASGVRWGRHAWLAGLAAWACIPLAHLVKHMLHLPDTLHPNTFASIFVLGAFTLSVAAIGTASGALLRAVLTARDDPS